jgi:hypothetical protein
MDMLVETGVSRGHFKTFSEKYPARCELSNFADGLLMFLFLLRQGVRLPLNVRIIRRFSEPDDEPDDYNFENSLEVIGCILRDAYNLDDYSCEQEANEVYHGDADIQSVWPSDWEIPENIDELMMQ